MRGGAARCPGQQQLAARRGNTLRRPAARGAEWGKQRGTSRGAPTLHRWTTAQELPHRGEEAGGTETRDVQLKQSNSMQGGGARK